MEKWIVECPDGRKVRRTPFNQHLSDEALCGLVAVKPPVSTPTPDGFVAIFGVEPLAADFSNYRDYQVARDQWQQDLKHFKGVGMPEWAADADLVNEQELFKHWGLGPGFVYEGRYGWMVRFPKQDVVPNFEVPLFTVLQSAHNVVASWQIAAASRGVRFEKEERHPWVPPHVFGDENE